MPDGLKDGALHASDRLPRVPQEPERLRFWKASSLRTQSTQSSLLIPNLTTFDGNTRRQEPSKFMEGSKITFNQSARPLAPLRFAGSEVFLKGLSLLF